MAADEPSRPREARKTVTVVFTDVAESTRLGDQLDPESVRRIMRRYFETASRALERHGGTVEKFIGDAVMAVFGVPTVHEDDALRAVRAVSELHESVDALNAELEEEQGVRLRLRTGVNTGEVVAGDPAAGQMFVTGDAVNVAARIEETAGPGEIVISEPTRRLVRDAVRVESLGNCPIRGREDGVLCWRLLEVFEQAPAIARRLDAPLIGRAHELAQLRESFERTVEERAPYLFTVFGPAGIGKSRLSAELASRVSESATVVTGRCLAYGDGITFWPVFEIVYELVGPTDHPEPELARLVADEEAADLIVERIAAVLGRAESAAAAEETFWAVRKLFEALARRSPLVVVLEDIHWGEPTFLDLIDHVADWSRDAPVFLLCLARADLLERRPAWGGGKLNAASILLAPLSQGDSSVLIDNLVGEAELPPEVRGRIMAAAEGNPLFVEQMLAMVGENGRADGELEIPPTIQALLAERLDRLAPDERAVIERAAVVGGRFWLGAVADLSEEAIRPDVGATLQLLLRKELVRPDRSIVPGEEGYRFRHQLIREAAYAGIPKEVRAELHERFVAWVEEHHGERLVEVEEIIGYHLEQAFRYRSELGRVDEHARELAARAAERLSSAGRRALVRGDASAGANLLGRAAALLDAEAPGREELLVDLGAASIMAGQLAEAEPALTEAVEAAAAAGNRRIELQASFERAFLRALTDPARGVGELRRVTEQALPELAKLGDDRGLARAWRRIGDLHWLTNRWEESEQALERALTHAERARDPREAAEARLRLPRAFYYGPTPVSEAVRRAEAVLERAGGARTVESTALVCLGGLHAMTGRFDESRELLAQGRAIAEELGMRVWLAGFSLVASDIELLADDPAAAERELRDGFEILEGMGERGVLARVAAALARALVDQERAEEAHGLTETSESLASADVTSQISWRTARALILARRGEAELAEELARQAVGLADGTDDLNRGGWVYLDLAEVLALRGRTDEAAAATERALGLFEKKGNSVAAEKARAALAGLN